MFRDWKIEQWLDVSPSIPYTDEAGDFEMNGIVATDDDKYLLVCKSNSGQLFRVSLRNKKITEVDLNGVSIGNCDGLVLKVCIVL